MRKALDLACPAAIVILLLGSAAGLRLSETATIALLLGGVALTGIPHGSLDPFVARSLWSGKAWFSMPVFLLVYAAIAAVCVVLWLTFPNAALTVFLAISAYHFGQDWPRKTDKFLALCYGICIVTLPCLFHSAEISRIYTLLRASSAPVIVRGAQPLGYMGLSAVATLGAVALGSRIRALFEVASVLTGAILLPPLVFFVCYFALLHSPRHLIATARVLGISSFFGTLRAALPITLVTVVAAIAAIGHANGSGLSASVLQVTFIGLAGLTVPHMLLHFAAETNGLRTEKHLHG